MYLALREGNAIYRIDPKTKKIFLLAGTGEQGYSGDGGPALKTKLSGPKDLLMLLTGSCTSSTPKTMLYDESISERV
jgi:hypothetical protein